MDLWSLMRVVKRRWFVAAPLVLLTFVVAFVASRSIPPEYEVDGALLLVGPSTVEVETGLGETQLEEQNPFLGFPSSLGTVARTMDLLLGSQETRSEFAAKGLEPGYVIGSDDRSPILQFLVTSVDRDVAVATMDELMNVVRSELQRSQDELDAPAGQRIAVQEISPDNEPSAGYSNKRRSQLLLLAVGLLATMFVTVAVDAVARRRGREAGDGRDEGADGPGAHPHDLRPPGVAHESMSQLVGASASPFTSTPPVAPPLTNGHALASTITGTDRNGAHATVDASADPGPMRVHVPADAAPAAPAPAASTPLFHPQATPAAPLGGVVVRRAAPGSGHPRPPLVGRSPLVATPAPMPVPRSPAFNGLGVGATAGTSFEYARPAQASAHETEGFVPPSRGLVDAMRARQPGGSGPRPFGGSGFGPISTS